MYVDNITCVCIYLGFMSFHSKFQNSDHYTLVTWVTKNIRCTRDVGKNELKQGINRLQGFIETKKHTYKHYTYGSPP